MRVFSLLFSILAFSLGAQNYQWAISDTTFGASNGISIVVDSSDNVFVVETYPVAQYVYGNRVMKYDNNKNLLWTQNIVGRLLEGGSVATDQGGNVYYVAGFQNTLTVNNTTYSTSTSGSFSMIFIKFNSFGVIQWVKKTTGADAGGAGISIDSQNNIYVVGGVGYGGTTILDTYTLNLGPFIAKCNINGTIQWVRSLGINAQGPYGINIKVSKNGCIYLGSSLSGAVSFGTFTVSSYGDTDPYLAKLDSSGNWLWAKHGGGIYQDAFYGMDVDNQDNVYVTGFFGSPTATFGAVSFSNTSNEDYFLAKYDANGNVQWAKHGVKDGYYANSFCVDSAGNSYMRPHNKFILKHDTYGTPVWSDTKTASNVRMVSDKKSSVYVTGWLSSPTVFGTTTITPIKSQQMYIAKLFDPPPATTKLSEMNKQSFIEVYPNPTQDYFSISSNTTDKVIVRITNALGQLVHSELVNTSERPAQKINIAHLSKGLYIAEVFDSRSKEILQTKKLIVN